MDNQTAAGFMQGKRGLIMGVANERSIAWGIAAKLAEQGAELAFTFQGEALQKRVVPLAASVGSVNLSCTFEVITQLKCFNGINLSSFNVA